MKIHDKIKALKCGICSKVFPSKAKLINHGRTHTGEKPFACKICYRKFAQKNTLVKHQATHSDVRPFKCSICPDGRYFKTKDQLRVHNKFHYEPKFACNYCDHKCYTSGDLKRHIKTHDKKRI